MPELTLHPYRSSDTGRRARHSAVVLGLLALVLVGGCTGGGGGGTARAAATTVTVGVGASGSTTPGPAVTVPPVLAGTGPSMSPEPSPTPTIPVTPPVSWTLTPAPDAVDVSPVAPISVAVADGTLQSVALTNPEGVPVPGALAADGRSWTSTEKLGYGRQYTVSAVAVGADGAAAPRDFGFRTLTPVGTVSADGFPADGMTVGVGQPIAITFDQPVADRAGVEKLVTVTTTPAVEGAFFWLDDTHLHWRPRAYWPAGTTVAVQAMIYGRDLGNGVYGKADLQFGFTIGPSRIAVVDDTTHTMLITIDGVPVKEMPVSLGRDKYPTYNGVHVVAEKYESKIMDSSTWGLTGTGAYRTEVGYATRISSSGEFVHAAPWSVDQQGSENVSHGCVNVSTENAVWFYENFGYGDVVDIRGTVGPALEVWDGFGDWQVPWETYQLGGAR